MLSPMISPEEMIKLLAIDPGIVPRGYAPSSLAPHIDQIFPLGRNSFTHRFDQ